MLRSIPCRSFSTSFFQMKPSREVADFLLSWRVSGTVVGRFGYVDGPRGNWKIDDGLGAREGRGGEVSDDR